MTDHGTDNLVAPEHACPTCGQRDMDQLVWMEDGERVCCQDCGTEYAPDTGCPAIRAPRADEIREAPISDRCGAAFGRPYGPTGGDQ